MSQFIEMFGTVENNTHNFPIMTIGEFANCFAGATPSTSHPEYWENGRIRWMSSGEVHKGHVEDTDSRITELGYKSASTRMVPIHSIVIAIAGQGKTRGTVAITEVDLCTNQSLCAIVPDERVNYSYLYHNLQGRYLELRGLSGDVNGRGGLNLKIIQKIPVILPPIEKQQQFASIAQQADKSKFGDFKSQFIEMFKGDNQVPLGDICNIEKGATITRNDVLPGEVPVVAGGQEPSCYHNVANREAGAITVSASGAYAGYINFWNCPIFASDCNTIISKDDEKTDQTFVYFGLRAMQKQIYGLQKGGAQPHVYGKDLQKFMFPCPSYAKQIEFSKMAKQADKSKSVIQKALVYLNDIQSDELGKIA